MHKRNPIAGFTLIEVLVVVIIVGTVLSVVLLSISNVGDSRLLQTEARRFATLLELSQEEAAMQGREYGVEIMTSGYRFVEYDPLTFRWGQILGDDTLRLRALPQDVEFELYLEDKRIVLEDDPKEISDPDDDRANSAGDSYSPHLFVFSSGDATPFELHLWRTFDDQRYIVTGDAIGAIEFGRPD